MRNVEVKMWNDSDWSTGQTTRSKLLHSLSHAAHGQHSGKLRNADVENSIVPMSSSASSCCHDDVVVSDNANVLMTTKQHADVSLMSSFRPTMTWSSLYTYYLTAFCNFCYCNATVKIEFYCTYRTEFCSICHVFRVYKNFPMFYLITVLLKIQDN